MKIQKQIITESGILISDQKDGFIVVGNIFTAAVDENGTPNGGLIGNNISDNVALCYDGQKTPQGSFIEMRCYTKPELLEALGFTVEELYDYIRIRKG